MAEIFSVCENTDTLDVMDNVEELDNKKSDFETETEENTVPKVSKIWQGSRSDPRFTAKCVKNLSYSKQE